MVISVMNCLCFCTLLDYLLAVSGALPYGHILCTVNCLYFVYRWLMLTVERSVLASFCNVCGFSYISRADWPAA